MGSECEPYYTAANIQFLPSYEDAAVYWTRSDPSLDWTEKKALITCWFDTTFGSWNGFRYDLKNSRQEMSSWLKRSGYASFEQFLQEEL